jgi:very-short-patch-repair endonuclease
VTSARSLRAQLGLLPSEWHEPPEKAPKISAPEELFATQCVMYRLPPALRQHLFAKQTLGRRWAFDFAFPEYWVAVEIDGVAVKRLAGQLVVMGRHASIEGIKGDHEKINTAILLGWSVLRFLQTDVKPRRAIETTMRVLAARGWKP